jgi:hypothetical protein
MVSGSMYRRNRDDFSVLVSLLLDFRGGKSIPRADVTSPALGPRVSGPPLRQGILVTARGPACPGRGPAQRRWRSGRRESDRGRSAGGVGGAGRTGREGGGAAGGGGGPAVGHVAAARRSRVLVRLVAP